MGVTAVAIENVAASIVLELDVVEGRASNVVHVNEANHGGVGVISNRIRSREKGNGREEEQKLSNVAAVC